MFKNIKIPTYYSRSINRLSNEQKWIILDNLFKYWNGLEVEITDDNVWDITELIFKDWMEIEDRRWPNHINSKTVVYYIRLYNELEDFIKIWISKDYESRFLSYVEVWYEIDILKITQFSNRADAILLEKKELKKFLNFKYTPKQEFWWKTECFYVDILDCIVNDSKIPKKTVDKKTVEESRIEESEEIVATKVATLETIIKDNINIEFFEKEYNADNLYIRQQLRDFYLHWSEKKINWKKEKWEMEKTFDVNRRFHKWLSNSANWNKAPKKESNNIIFTNDI